MSWSKEQLTAIQARHKNLLVAAAAGSGKTSVLVERIIQRVLDRKEPVDIDRMLVVTFTNAAAAEMRERVGAALTQALKERPDAKNIERQLLLLNSASISTIHAFCQSVIRQHFHLLGLSPKFRVANEVETGLLKMNLLERLFEEKYDAAEPDFLGVVEHYGGEKSDDSLYDLILSLYDFSRSHPKADAWLQGLTENFALPEDTDIEATPWSKIIRDKMILDLKGSQQELALLCGELERPGSPDAYLATFQSDIIVLEELIKGAKASWQCLYTALNTLEFERLPAVGKEFTKETKEYFQGARNKIKKKISEVRDALFTRPPEELLSDMRKAAPDVAALVSLVREFGAAYAKVKRDKGLLDFNDLEHYCLRVLAEDRPDGSLCPSSAAKALQEKYVEIMVDEYQDTNGVQEAILQLVARAGEPNLFMVGDVKQSIYRFRLAEPELFLQKYRSYGGDGSQECRIDLAKNFRSRACILTAINFVFRQVMNPDVVELEYGDEECLNPGADYPATDKPCLKGPVEVLLIDKTNGQESFQDETVNDAEEPTEDVSEPKEEAAEDMSGFELESRLIVRRIKELYASGYHVWDKAAKQYRPLAWRDIVILLRSVKGKADMLLEAMRQAGIPVYAELSEGYFQEIEVQVLLSLLYVVDNPRQDIHLAGILRSPLFHFSEPELIEIRLCDRQGDLWDAVLKAAEVPDGEQAALGQKVRSFLVQINRWRNLSRSKGVPELVWQIYRDTGYYDYVGGLPGGVIRQANLRALYDRARQYENTNFHGLFRFLRFIENLRNRGSDLSIARALGESENVVRVMSIHKSKGIEFPVVIVADMNKQFNMQDSRQNVVKHKRLGLGVYVSPPELRLRYPTLARYGIQITQEMETRAEELRILYVAMTRAREKLILTGSVKELAQKCRKWYGQAAAAGVFLPDSCIAGAVSYMDWLGPALMRHADGGALAKYAGCEPETGLPAEEDFRWDITVFHAAGLQQQEEHKLDMALFEQIKRLAPLEPGEGTEWVDKVLGWQYAQRITVDKPAKMSVTEIKRRFETLNREDGERLYENKSLYDQPRFMQKRSRMTAAELGTAMHTVMQHVDIRGDISLQGLKLQLEGLVEKEILLPEHAAEIDLQAVAAFFQGTLGQRMLAAGYLEREVPFSLMLPAVQFYPEMRGLEEKIFVQGVIDCLFRDRQGLVLLDYKTDHRHNRAEELTEKYAVQLRIYAQAVQAIFREEVTEKYLYVFSTGETVKL